jgi:hypothetical protein
MKLIRLLTVAAMAAAATTIAIPATQAGSLPGFTIFGGVGNNELSYRLDYGTRNAWDRYSLHVPGSRIPVGVARFQISYPSHYSGTFDTKAVEVKVGDRNIPVKDVNWNRERNQIMIDLQELLKTEGQITVTLNNVRNPNNAGMFFFKCETKSSPDFPLAREIGTWILNID